jgi:glycosyltransferase involved in cell wall biosynthesis
MQQCTVNSAHVSEPFLSFVVPVYGAPESLEPLQERIAAVCGKLNVTYELILVDDRCPKGSWRVVLQLAAKDSNVVAVRLSRNFGQHAAIHSGLSRVRGQWIVVMDCDLQDRPEDVPALLTKAKEGFDIVLAVRGTRDDPWLRKIASRLFYRVLSFMTDTDQTPEVGNFGVYRRKVIDTINAWSEQSKYFPAIVQWVGFSRTYVPVDRDKRHEGSSSYTLSKLVNLAMTVVIGFSDKPLKLVMSCGLAVALLSFFASSVLFLLHVAGRFTVEGWTSIMLSLWFIGGCTAFVIGLSGLYIGRVLVEVKGRPSYIVDQVVRSVGSSELTGDGRIAQFPLVASTRDLPKGIAPLVEG